MQPHFPSPLDSHQRPDLADMRPNDWVARYLPDAWGPYARLCRLDRPVGTWLTLLPCIAALIQAAGGWPDLWRLFIFSLGALLMRGVGCCFNDIFDRNFDHQVERTRFRPLTSGQLSLRNALIFVFVQLLIAGLLLLAINSYSRWLALLLLPLVVIYPLCKRFTHWPQAVLGIAFNWGMLMAWSDTQNIVPLAAIAMWAGAVTWQIAYDAIYGYIDMEDDLKLGLKSAAIRFGDNGKQWLGGFYTATMLLWIGAGYAMQMGWGYFVVMFAIGVHLIWQIYQFNPQRRESGLPLFRANMTVGILLVVAALAGTLL